MMSSLSYSLEIGQQPVRARMCGFGDKDPRHVSPPPCIKLNITRWAPPPDGQGPPVAEPVDISTHDLSSLVLVAELWSEDMTQNLSYISVAGVQNGASRSADPPSGAGDLSKLAEGPLPQMEAMPIVVASSGTPMAVLPAGGPIPEPPLEYSTSIPETPLHNLRGALVATPNIVKGLDDQLGIWFILHHLNIRAEGTYRLKFSITDLNQALDHSSDTSNNNNNMVLAEVFSDPLKVFSAKKFPGVYPYTELSQCFIKQGLRISIRTGIKRRRSTSEADAITPAITPVLESTTIPTEAEGERDSKNGVSEKYDAITNDSNPADSLASLPTTTIATASGISSTPVYNIDQVAINNEVPMAYYSNMNPEYTNLNQNLPNEPVATTDGSTYPLNYTPFLDPDALINYK